MHDDMSDQAIETDGNGKAQNGLDRAGRLRERIRLSQAIAAQRARIEATGGKPSEDEAARMVSEFHARGGQVTICPPADDTLGDSETSHSKRRPDYAATSASLSRRRASAGSARRQSPGAAA